MELNIRVLNIRKHKNVTFLDSYTSRFGKIQVMYDNELSFPVCCGDLICADVFIETNNRGNKVLRLNKLIKIIPSFEADLYNPNNHGSQREIDFINARNGGMQISLLEYKIKLVEEIKKVLIQKNYIDASLFINTVERFQNGSNIKDAVIKDRSDSEPKYLRVTFENQLKQMSGLTLNSTFAIDKVFRNMGEDNGHINEFLMLEFVSLHEDIDDIINFIFEIDALSRSVKNDYNLNTLKECDNLEVVSYSSLLKNTSDFSLIQHELKNVLIKDFPCDSPYIKSYDNFQSEVRWYMNGKWICHFYEDENDYNEIEKNLKLQDQNTGKENTNPMSYFKWGLPDSTSLGLSIDRWLQLFLGLENINSIANPIGLDYVKKRRKK